MQLDSINPAKSDYQRMASLLSQRHTKRRGLSMPEFAETTVVTAGKMKGQKFDLRYSPYARRPMECLSPESPIQLVVMMFPSQSTKSVVGQICAGYYSKELPSEILYVVPDLVSARKVMERRLEPLYNSIDIEFRTQSENKKSRRTGDVTFSKEFDGGNIDIVTANSSAALAAETKRVLVGDELGKWKKVIGAEGSPWGQSWARLKSWGDEKKALAISTPTDFEECAIHELYLTGTQEIWEVPCPKCGTMQMLAVKGKSGYGLDWKTVRDRIVRSSIVYVCKKCAKSFKETKKFDIQQDGIWTPSAEPQDEYTVSFNIHVLNSMFETWYEVAKNYTAGIDNHIARKEFTNHSEGMPYRHTGSRPKADTVIKNRGNYPSGTVPDGVLYLTAAADVQRGSDKWKDHTDAQLVAEVAKAGDKAHEMKFPRLEIEVLGTGPGYRTFSIDYRVFYGKVKNAFSGAWEIMNQWASDLQRENGAFGYRREKDGKVFPVMLTLIDSGHDPDTVYMFSQRWTNCYPSKGFKLIKTKKNEKKDQLTKDDFRRYRFGKVGAGDNILLYEISTNHYKQRIYNNLGILRIDQDIQSPGFQDFPRNYTKRYFDMLTAEEKLVDGNYDNMGRPNESLDCRVGAACAADVYLDSYVDNLKLHYKVKKKYDAIKLKEINHRFAILAMSKLAGIDVRFNERG